VSERLLTADEVAARLNVPTSWVREATRSGGMPCVELGRYRRYEPDAIDEWLKTCRMAGRPVTFRTAGPAA
jgi:excisionase family DNA binding protein